MFSHHERVNMAISKSGLPKTVLELFDPRQDLEYTPPIDKKPPVLPLIGLAGYVAHFPDPDDPEYQPERSELTTSESRTYRSKEYYLQVSLGEPTILERREAKAEERKTVHTQSLEAGIATYDAKSDPNAAGTDAMRTLFVSRLDYSITESDLYAEFEKHGAIRELKLIRNADGKSRGYAFIEYQHGGDMKKAYKAYPETGVRIGASERLSLVDVERGRTVQGWKPMRLGGGRGGDTRLPKAKKEKKVPGLAAPGMPPPPPPGMQADRDRRPGYAGGDSRAAPPPRSVGDRDRGQENGGRDRDRFAGGAPRDRAPPAGGRAERDRGDDYGGRGDRFDRSRDSRPSGGYRDDRLGGSNHREDRYGGGSRDRDSGYGGHKRERDYSREDRGHGSYENRGAGTPHGRGGYGERDRRGGGGGDAAWGNRDRDAKRGRYDNGHGHRSSGDYGAGGGRGERSYAGDRGNYRR